jgi:hypothetical protein
MPYFFNPGAIPGVHDKAGRAEFKKAMIEEIKKLGGRPKESMGFDTLRQMRRELRAKNESPEKDKPKEILPVTPISVAPKLTAPKARKKK